MTMFEFLAGPPAPPFHIPQDAVCPACGSREMHKYLAYNRPQPALICACERLYRLVEDPSLFSAPGIAADHDGLGVLIWWLTNSARALAAMTLMFIVGLWWGSGWSVLLKVLGAAAFLFGPLLYVTAGRSRFEIRRGRLWVRKSFPWRSHSLPIDIIAEIATYAWESELEESRAVRLFSAVQARLTNGKRVSLFRNRELVAREFDRTAVVEFYLRRMLATARLLPAEYSPC